MHTKFEKSYLNGDGYNDITMFATDICRLCSHTRHTANHTLTTVQESDKFTYINYIKKIWPMFYDLKADFQDIYVVLAKRLHPSYKNIKRMVKLNNCYRCL